MKRLLNRPRAVLGGLLACAGLLATAGPALAANVDVGVSIDISQPGVYGRIDIGRFPQPAVIVQQPVIIYRHAAPPPPIYLWVPPGHQKHWSKHCRDYNACGVPVYFVQDRWYQDHVMRDAGRPPERGERRDYGRDDRGDHDRGRGHGRGEGRGHRD